LELGSPVGAVQQLEQITALFFPGDLQQVESLCHDASPPFKN
jgi:hypothetical protein